MSKIELDQQTVRLMIAIYCRHHLHQQEPSAEYQSLADYACKRLEYCLFGERKPACKDCLVHCYKKEMRERMRQVMRWTGPRMLLYSPRAAMRHIFQCLLKHR